ncbi:MAG TPA: indolepyruvate oxidoreductase subunit beta [Methanomicrobia archaeon]|nr:indolepyruvate oxidoreductase subunit beta [Methanomicrobia archaeon]
MKTSTCDIIVVGVGGQGVILLAHVIGKSALKAGYSVRGAETHGMAQRGGSVITHIRIGCIYGPLVPPGGADILVALEPAEALRYAHYLVKDGVVLVNTNPILPVTVTTGRATYPPLDELCAPLQYISKTVKAVNATELAIDAGTPQAMNVVMLGLLAAYLPLPEELLLETLAESIKPKYLAMNKRAFELGKQACLSERVRYLY